MHKVGSHKGTNQPFDANKTVGSPLSLVNVPANQNVGFQDCNRILVNMKAFFLHESSGAVMTQVITFSGII